MCKAILVTGGTGQVGSAVVRALLARGERVRCLVRNPEKPGPLDGLSVERVTGDVLSSDSLDAACQGVGSIIHAAGLVSYWAPLATELHHVNTEGTKNLLRAALGAGVERFVFTSSIATLGWAEDGEHGDEETPFNWTDMAYFESKRAAEQAVLGSQDLEAVAVNPGIILGRLDVKRNAGRMLLQLHQGKVRSAPPGATTLVNLTDAVEGHLLALDKGRAGERYVLGGTTLSFLEVFSRMATVLEVPAPSRIAAPWQMRMLGSLHELRGAILRREPSFNRSLAEICCRNRRYRSAKAERELGYRPGEIEEGIVDCWSWYQELGLT